MKITRIIEYEGEEKDLLIQLGRSLPDGIKETSNVKISVITLGNISLLELYKKQDINDKELQKTYPGHSDGFW